jgi:hypothetical protein
VNVTGGNTGFATALGGSCNVRLWSDAFLSPSVDYIFTSINSVHENSFRMGIGLTYAFGEPAKGTALPVSSPTSTKIPGLGVNVIPHTDSGVEILEVQPSSPAESVYRVWAM